MCLSVCTDLKLVFDTKRLQSVSDLLHNLISVDLIKDTFGGSQRIGY